MPVDQGALRRWNVKAGPVIPRARALHEAASASQTCSDYVRMGKRDYSWPEPSNREERRHDMKPIARGAVSGLAGTAMMTAAMLPLKKVSMSPGTVAPRQITENLLNKLGLRRYLSMPAFEASWMTLHFGYGLASGVAYALAQEAFEGEGTLLVGPLFGMVLWAVGYCGWLPLFGIYPSPIRLPKRKVGAELITTHLIYGTGVAVVHRVLQD